MIYLIKFFFVYLAVSNLAWADTVTPPIVFKSVWQGVAQVESSLSAVCTSYKARSGSTVTITNCAYSGTGTPTSDNIIMYWSSPFAGSAVAGNGSQTCPAGSTQAGTFPNRTCQVTCAPGERYYDGSCQPAIDCNAEKGKDTGTLSVPSETYSSTLCYKGCTVKSGDAPCGDGQCVYINNVFTGTTCQATTSTPPTTPEQDCLAQGSSYGTVNGVTVCVPNGTQGTPLVKTTGTGTKTETTSAGSTTTSTTTTTNNTTVTTTTTTTNPNGTTETKTKEQDKPSFCEENPNSKICKEDEETSFGGTCGSFTCDGDAIQCAQAKEQHKRNCELIDKTNSFSDLGNNLINGNDTVQNPAKTENRDVLNIGDSLDEGNGIGGGTFQDKTISLPGGGVTLPFSQINWIMQLLGGFILAAAYINAARIVGVR